MTTADDTLDHSPFGKGKYARQTPSDVAEKDPSYVVWAYESWDPKPCSKLLYEDCLREAREANSTYWRNKAGFL